MRPRWEYRYNYNATAKEIFSVHTMAEVREAYDTIIPGEFKADLFWYCVLLITGGIYANMYVMLGQRMHPEANLITGCVFGMDLLLQNFLIPT